MINVLEIIKTRRSVRKFSARQLEEDKLQAILEAGLYAPSGGNGQPWHFLVIQNKAILDYMSEQTKLLMAKAPVDRVAKAGRSPEYHVFHHAPTVVIVSGLRTAKSPIVADYKFADYTPLADCSAAVQNMLIAAESFGVASCWIGYIQYLFAVEHEVKKLTIPPEYQPIFAVSFGYKDEAVGELSAPKRKAAPVSYMC